MVLHASHEVLEAQLVLDREDHRPARSQVAAHGVQEAAGSRRAADLRARVLEDPDHGDQVEALLSGKVLQRAADHLHGVEVAAPLRRDLGPSHVPLEGEHARRPLAEVPRQRAGAGADVQHARALRDLDRSQEVRPLVGEVVSSRPVDDVAVELVRAGREVDGLLKEAEETLL